MYVELKQDASLCSRPLPKHMANFIAGASSLFSAVRSPYSLGSSASAPSTLSVYSMNINQQADQVVRDNDAFNQLRRRA